MKYAMVGNAEALEISLNLGQSMHMLLGQYLPKEPRYFKMARELRLRSAYFIVDNGEDEEGFHPDVFENIIQACRFLEPDEIVLPDKQHDPEVSWELLEQYADWVSPKKRMFVAHGLTMVAVLEYIERVMDKWKMTSVGIPKYLEWRIPGGRFAVLEAIENARIFQNIHVHLLGLHTRWPTDNVDKTIRRYPWIRSFDTSAPFSWAQQSFRIDMPLPEFHTISPEGEKLPCKIPSYQWDTGFPRDLAAFNLRAMQEATCISR